MVGFEVTPLTASSSIIRASSTGVEQVAGEVVDPDALAERGETVQPRVRHDHPFQSFDLLESLEVPLSSPEASLEERPHEVGGELGSDDLGAEAEHVHVVVLHSLVGGVDVVAHGGADPRQLARRDRGTDARAADEHATIGRSCQQRLAELARLVRVVDPDGIVCGAEVDRLVTELRELLQHALPQLHAAMIERDRHLHAP